MSSYKPIYSSLWTDNKFENFSPEKKLLFLFLLTNQFVEKTGIYKITVRQIAFYTGLTNDFINDFINELINEHKIMYDFDNGIIFIKNVFRYQKGMIKNENILLLTIQRNYKMVKTDFWNSFFEVYNEDPIISKIKDLLINESLMAHQLYINNNKNKNNNGKEVKGEKPKTSKEPKGFQKPAMEKEQLEKDFEEFWESYSPVKTLDGKFTDKGSKKLARIAYEKSRRVHSQDVIFDGCVQYLLDCHKNNRLTCAVTTFLNQERFLIDSNQQLLEVKKND